MGEKTVRLRRNGSTEELCLACAAEPRSGSSMTPVRTLADRLPVETWTTREAA
jgi:hypothetical protein